jgi:anti-sigma factor ChrR (cupin superfamily)
VTESINGDLQVRASVDTTTLDWTASPSGTVWRKRVHLVGGAESGQVTSLVRYEPGATFPEHDHPEGEEILVLDGVFSDEHGDWPAGSYLLNPEGFRHAPYSEPGCLIFVKLRQFPGREREHLATMRLERWAPGTTRPSINFAKGAEILVIDGSFQAEEGLYGTHSWLRVPPGTGITAESDEGCTLYIKEGGATYLRGAT